MSNVFQSDPFKDGSSFFGFMGVSLALVLASICFIIKIWELLMVLLKQEQESVAFLFGDLQLSWSHSFQWSWPVSWVFTEWLSLLFSVKKVNRFLNLVKKGEYNYHDGYKHMASGLVCGFSCVVNYIIKLGCRIHDRNRRR